MELPIVVALIGIVGNLTIAWIVWRLSENSFSKREDLERKKAIGRALTVLLEIRNRILIVPNEKDFEDFLDRLKIPRRLRPFYKRIVEKLARQSSFPFPNL